MEKSKQIRGFAPFRDSAHQQEVYNEVLDVIPKGQHFRLALYFGMLESTIVEGYSSKDHKTGYQNNYCCAECGSGDINKEARVHLNDTIQWHGKEYAQVVTVFDDAGRFCDDCGDWCGVNKGNKRNLI